MKNTDDTRRLPGLVPRICSAGRTVAAVVWTAPATMPSTSPCWSIMVPTMIGSARCSRATSSVQPWCRRSSGQRGDVTLGDGLGVDDGDAVGQLQPEAAGQPGHLVGRSQQHAAGDASLRARDRGLQRARLGALGQHHARVGGAGPLDQLVAEGGGAEPARPRGAGQRLQPGRVQRIGDAVDHALDPLQVVDRQSRVEGAHPRRGLVAVVVDDENGQAGGGRGLGELPYPRVRHDPGGTAAARPAGSR